MNERIVISCILILLNQTFLAHGPTLEENSSARTEKKPNAKENKKKPKKEKLVKAQDLHNYFMANYFQFGGKMKLSYEHYKNLIEQDAPVYIYNGYIHLLNDTQNYQHVLQLIPKLEDLFPEDASLQLIFAQVLEKTGKHEQSDEKFIKLNDKFKTNQEIAFSAANSFLRRKEPENAIHVIDKLLNTAPPRPNNFIFYFMKSQIYTQLSSDANASQSVKQENKTKALESVRKSLDLHPRFDKGLLLHALLNEQAGELDNAIKGYSKFLEVTGGSNREVEQHLLQLIFKQKIQQRDINKSNNSVTLNRQCFDKALSFFDQKQYERAIEQIDGCLKEKPNDDESKLLKIQILSAMQQPQKVAQQLKSWIQQDPNNSMWYQTTHLLTQGGISTQQALDLLKEVESQQPHNILPVLYLADLYTRAHNQTQALNYQQKALTLTTDNALKAKILYQMGIMYYDTKNDKGMKQVITQASNIHATFAPLLNLIAYYYVHQEDNTLQAQKLMDIVLTSDGTNPHFLDTQALIFYKQKKYEQALILLKKIAQIVPSDYTILIHLATTHYQSGETKDALVALDKAKQYAKTAEQSHECEQLFKQWKTKKA